jgi:hypothetical protein
MFTEITWATYLRVTAAALFLYYTFLLLKSYLPQIRASLSNGSMAFSQSLTTEVNPTAGIGGEQGNLVPAGEFHEPGYSDYEIIEEMVDRVKGALKEAVANEQGEDTIIVQLKAIVNDYPLLSKSNFRPSINEFIATESQQHGFTSITEEVAEQFLENYII